ncbi:MAG: MFS transporter [Actinomycetota bacterium]
MTAREPDGPEPTAEPPDASERGTAREALSVPEFRRLYVGSTLSNTGRWMQTAALGVLGWKISESSAYLGAIIFAQLGPLGILSLIGGSLADTADRRLLLLWTQAWQMVWTFVLAFLLIDGNIGQGMLLLIVFVIGLGQGLYAPALTSVIPSIAGERNLSAAIALNSMQINGTRVVGPALGGFLVSIWGFAEVFAINGISYLFVVSAIYLTRIPPGTALARTFRERVFGGFTIAWRAPQVGRPIGLMFLFAFLCLPFIGQLPAIAEVNLGIDSESTTYGWFYACFGLGGLCGAFLVGTVFLRTPATRIVAVALVGFAVSIAWLAVLEDINFAYIAIFLVGTFYFALPTALSTAWQEHVSSDVRGRVSALWVLAFGGTVPIANVLAGQLVELTSLRAVLMFGAVSAIALTALRLPSGPVVGEEILDGP